MPIPNGCAWWFVTTPRMSVLRPMPSANWETMRKQKLKAEKALTANVERQSTESRRVQRQWEQILKKNADPDELGELGY